VHGSLVIVSADHGGGGFLAGLHRETGELIWKKARPPVGSCSSAVVAPHGAESLLVISGCDLLAAYHPNTGREIWTVSGLSETTCGTCVWDADRIYASGGYPDKQTIAVTKTGQQVWSNRVKCYESSMLIHGGHLYAISDSGVGYCWEAATGEEKWKKRLGGNYSASLVLAKGNIYITSETGKMTIISAEPESYTLVAENQLGNEAFATPAICGGKMYHRVAVRGSDGREEWLYCIGEESP
jgi:outer membrane protein assembly factor BamB